MKNVLNLVLYSIVVFIATLAIGYGSYLAIQTQSARGSVIQSSEYQSYNATSTAASDTTIHELVDGSGALGSIVISSSSPVTSYPAMTIYDATSTMATSTSRVIAQFGPNNQEHGTYTFDANVFIGLSIEFPSDFDGNYTVTYRP